MARGGRSGRARGEVAEICKALDHLTSMNGAKPEVIQMKRDCFQKLLRYMTQVGKRLNFGFVLLQAPKMQGAGPGCRRRSPQGTGSPSRMRC